MPMVEITAAIIATGLALAVYGSLRSETVSRFTALGLALAVFGVSYGFISSLGLAVHRSATAKGPLTPNASSD